MQRAVREVLDLVFPRQCAACGGAVGRELCHVCWDCLAGMWPVCSPFCSMCGDPVPGPIQHHYTCSLCVGHPPGFDYARSAFMYRGAMADLIKALKYHHDLHLSRDLATMLLACVNVHYSAIDIDAVIFVPLHRRKEIKRTYNQSRLIARELARMLGKPLIPDALQRVRDTPSQTELTSVQRRKNVRGAFRVCRPQWLDGRRCLLVDDVMSTGSTVSECARELKKAGAAAVRVVTVARG